MGKVNLTITLIIEPLVKSICPNRFFILSVKDGFCEYVSLIFISFCFPIVVSSFHTDIALCCFNGYCIIFVLHIAVKRFEKSERVKFCKQIAQSVCIDCAVPLY